KLRKEIGVKLNAPVNEDDLQKARQKIIDSYQSKGFTDIAVDFRVEPIDESRGTARVIYTVKEGVKGAVKQIRFQGNKHFSERILRKQMKTRGKTMISIIDKSGRLDEDQLHDDAKAIADAYGRGGYVDLVILPQGAPAGAGLIDVHYKIEEGNRSFVERINIVGNTRTKDKVLRREILVAPGDVFDTVRVETSKKRLENLGYFSKVDTYPEETGVEGRKDLVV